MKKKLINFLLLAVVGGVLISCDDDDNGLQLGVPETPEIPESATVASVYHGQVVRIIEQQDGQNVKNVTEEAVRNNIYLIGEKNSQLVTLKMQNLRLVNGQSIDQWQISDITLLKDGDKYYLNAEARDMALWEEKNGRIAQVYVSGTVEDDSLHVTVDIKTPGFHGVYSENMNFKFDGKAGHKVGTEAEITAFKIENNALVNKVSLNREQKEITILVNKEAADSELLFKAEVENSEGAYLYNGYRDFNGELDFTRTTSTTIKVVSEDGQVENSYKVYCIKLMDLNFTFDSWSSANGFEETDGWNSNNMDFLYLQLMGGYTGEYPLQKGNSSAIIKTVDANGLTVYGPLYKKAMSGYLYFGGEFDINLPAAGKFAEANKLGVLYKSQPKPLKFKGKYSYQAGGDVYDTDGNIVTGATDECLLGFYLYEVAKESETLDAVSIHSSEKVVAKAEVTMGTTNVEETFNVGITYKDGYTYDVAKTYKLVILLASSKNGHIYQGAPGSTLTVSEVSVITE